MDNLPRKYIWTTISQFTKVGFHRMMTTFQSTSQEAPTRYELWTSIMTGNMNSRLKMARNLSLVTRVETMRAKTTTYFYKRNFEGTLMTALFTHPVLSKLQDLEENRYKWLVNILALTFYDVDFGTRTCSYCRSYRSSLCTGFEREKTSRRIILQWILPFRKL